VIYLLRLLRGLRTAYRIAFGFPFTLVATALHGCLPTRITAPLLPLRCCYARVCSSTRSHCIVTTCYRRITLHARHVHLLRDATLFAVTTSAFYRLTAFVHFITTPLLRSRITRILHCRCYATRCLPFYGFVSDLRLYHNYVVRLLRCNGLLRVYAHTPLINTPFYAAVVGLPPMPHDVYHTLLRLCRTRPVVVTFPSTPRPALPTAVWILRYLIGCALPTPFLQRPVSTG